jgi:TRAP transporter TAXI family solute receptor
MVRPVTTSRLRAPARFALALVAVLGALALAGCARGPDAGFVKESVQQQLDAALGGRVLTVESLRPSGGTALKGGDGRVVYFNARMKLARDYDFTQWNAHSVASLGALLGAGPKGLIGLKADGNKAGDEIDVFGTAAFARRDGRYEQVALTPSAAAPETPLPAAATVAAVQPRPKEEPPPTPLEAAYARLAELAKIPGTVTRDEHDAILREEIDAAHSRARARLERAATVLTIAGGPAGGAYADTLRALEVRAFAAKIALDPIVTEGSVANIRQLYDGRAQFALVQNDVARNAFAGRGRFAGAPQPELRVVASLFPEAVHLVVGAKSGITGVADLKGKRVELGSDGSGTRANALAILNVNGIAVETLAAAGRAPLAEAAQALADGKVDALFATIHAPARELQRLAARTPVSLVPIGPSRELLDVGLAPLTLPAGTYHGQVAPVPTLAATALLVTRENVPARAVDAMLKLLFDARAGDDAAAVAHIARPTARVGVSLPWHPAADAWLGTAGTPGPASAPAVALPAVPPVTSPKSGGK